MSYRRKMLEAKRVQKRLVNKKHAEDGRFHLKDTNLKVDYKALNRQCLKKNMYSTERMAERIKQKLLAERGEKLRVYHCYNCGFFHITHRL